jgi:hypothetical protein
MTRPSACVCVSFAGLACAQGAHGTIAYVAQERTITASTTANLSTVTLSAPDFAPFVETVSTSTTFQTPNGPAINTGGTTIDCDVNPNAIRANGSLTGAGGLNVAGDLEAGEACAFIFITFDIGVSTSFTMLATPRPSLDPRDEFEIELSNLTTTEQLFRLDETSPPQSVNLSGVLQPGRYTLQFQVEMTVEGPELVQNFDFRFLVPTPGAAVLLACAPMVMVRRRR